MAVQLGYTNVHRDPRGYPDWKASGYPVEQTPAGVSYMSGEPETPGALHGWAMIWTLLGLFAGGVALNLTPCVYPLIPITVSYFGGRSGQGRRGLITHGLLYVGGLALTNSILGVGAALTGGLVGAMLQNTWVLVAVAGVLVFFATSLFGFWELRLPGALTQAASRTYAGYFGSLFMGVTLGVVAAPCIGPFILGLLTWVAGMGSPWLGFIVFFTLSLGLGLPLFLLAVFSGQLERLPRSGQWMVWVRKLMGWVLVAMAAYFVRPVLPESAGVFLLAAVLAAAGIHLGWISDRVAASKAFEWFKTLLGMAGLISATVLIGSWMTRGPGVAWQSYSAALLAEAREAAKPVIIDFYADWCAPCRELEEITFHDPEVVKKAADRFVMIKVDLTGKTTEAERAILEAYQVKGVPTVVFLDSRGMERTDLRLLDFLPAKDFLLRMSNTAGEATAGSRRPVSDWPWRLPSRLQTASGAAWTASS